MHLHGHLESRKMAGQRESDDGGAAAGPGESAGGEVEEHGTGTSPKVRFLQEEREKMYTEFVAEFLGSGVT